MLYIETPDDKLEAYTKERCDEIRKEYDDLKRCIVKMMNTEDELEMFNLVTHKLSVSFHTSTSTHLIGICMRMSQVSVYLTKYQH